MLVESSSSTGPDIWDLEMDRRAEESERLRRPLPLGMLGVEAFLVSVRPIAIVVYRRKKSPAM